MADLDHRAAGGRRLKDKVCIVTGAGQGIGRAAAKRLGAEGGIVVVADRVDEGATQTMAELNEHGVTALKVLALLPPFSMSLSFSMLWPGIVAYGVLANLFYSLGFMTEAAMQRAWRDETPRVGPPLFRQGLIFSVGLTLLPIAAMGIAKVAMLVKWIVG